MTELTTVQKKVQEWLSTPPADRELEAGATLMLQITRNRILHQNVIRKRNFDKIEYVLRKYIGNLIIIKPEIDESTALENAEKAAAAVNLENSKGKRSDHDSLPGDIQSIYDANVDLYHIMRSLHEKLKIMSDDNKFSPSERLKLLNSLISADDTNRENWQKYDSYDPESANSSGKVSLDVKRVQANRTYLSRTAKMEKDKDKVKAECLLRYNELIADGQSVDPELVGRLIQLGVIPPGSDAE
jgi:hypothetical protein